MSPTIGEIKVTIVRISGPGQIKDLIWDESPSQVTTTIVNGQPVKMAKFKGKMESLKGNTLIYSVQGIMKSARISDTDGSFEVLIPVTGVDQVVQLRAIDDYGNTYDDRIKIKSEIDYTQIAQHWNFDLGAAMSYLDYTESFRNISADVTEMGLTIKGGANYALSSKFELGANTFFTALPIALKTEQVGKNSAGVVTYNNPNLSPARWYGINARLGYRFPFKSQHASFHAMTGWYIWGMNVPAKSALDTYGIKVLGGPQFFLTSRFRSKKSRASAVYIKFATVQDSGGLFSFQNRELAIGGSIQISKPSEKRGRWMLTTDIAQTRFANAEGFHFRFLTLNTGISRSF